MRHWSAAALVVSALVGWTLLGCAGHRPPEADETAAALSPAEAHAGEVLAYLMQVVLGRAGNPEQRAEWATRGLGVRLEFSEIARIMDDSGESKRDLLVFDADILGLSNVLYHYDPNFNQFKGRAGRQSVYPSSELVALRLLLLNKMHRGEQIRVAQLLRRQSLLLNAGADARPEDLTATGLRPDEMRLLRDVFASEPDLFRYLGSADLLQALRRLDAVAVDPVVQRATARAPGHGAVCRPISGNPSSASLRLAILPSLISEFEYGPPNPAGGSTADFRPTPFFKDMVERFVTTVRNEFRAALRAAISPGDLQAGSTAIADPAADRVWSAHVAVLLEDGRPLVVVPANAPDVEAAVCPDADITVVLMGKDVYLSLDLGTADVYPAVNRFYIDIMDIQRGLIQTAAQQIAHHVLEQILEAALVNGR